MAPGQAEELFLPAALFSEMTVGIDLLPRVPVVRYYQQTDSDNGMSQCQPQIDFDNGIDRYQPRTDFDHRT